MKIAVVRVRGMINIRKEIRDTLAMLRLYNKNYCTVIEDTPQNKGMLKKAKDFVTYGPISEEVFKEIVEKRGEEYTGRDKTKKIDYSRRYFESDGKKYKKYFRLHPPKKGFGRKGIKVPFSKSGALGDRKEKINDLLKRMI
ncbi:50S ribosomal protein L30 [Candidatus Woesearchaeota archaeon]|nr:50S ribosomal protein L30 [Candidatus Woesearchaeota archaeon]